MMQLKRLEFDTVQQIYKDHLCNDFVPAEQKPYAVIHILMRMGLYHCYGLYDEQTLKGYAFFCTNVVNNAKIALLDYFVVLHGMRGCGLGSTFLSLIKEEFAEYDCILAEVERVEASDSETDRMVREKRKAFYLRNGLTITNLSVDLFGEDLQIYQLPLQKVHEESYIYNKLNDIYDRMFYEKDIRKQVVLRK